MWDQGRRAAPRPPRGEVGSGKPVAATAALVACLEGGYQAALMAPTEIRAEQHALTLRSLLEPLGLNVYLLVGGTPSSARGAGLDALRRGTGNVVVGTHALLEDRVMFDRLRLGVGGWGN